MLAIPTTNMDECTSAYGQFRFSEHFGRVMFYGVFCADTRNLCITQRVKKNRDSIPMTCSNICARDFQRARF